jgi:hypothetical protein
MSALQQVHVRVNDAATGKPTPVRVRFAGPDGTYYPPHGRLAEFATDVGADVGGNVLIEDRQFAFIDGTCEVLLPVAIPLHVEISKGPEYKPIVTELTVQAGKLALRYQLERWIDLRSRQWYSGDACAFELTPHAALLEAAAEDVAVVNLLAEETRVAAGEGGWRAAIPNILAFSGQAPALERPGHMVVVNTANRHSILGSLYLLNCHRVVYPLTVGGPGRPDDWTLADWCDQCHRKGGLVISPGFFGRESRYPQGETLADLLLGKINALEIGDFENPDIDAEAVQPSVLRRWYALLTCDLRVPLVAGSCKASNLDLVGRPRTYAHLEPGQEFNYRTWIEAVRAGRTFVTNGPLLSFTVDGQGPGSVLELSSPTQPVRARADAQSLVPFAHLEVVANGTVIGRADAAGEPASATLEAEVTLPSGGWLVARCWGDYDDAMEEWVAAITSPVYLTVAGQRPRTDPATLVPLFDQLDRMVEWVNREGRFENDQQRQRLAGVFESAREALLRKAQTG